MLLTELIEPSRRVAVVGLAKNTGKTETLGAILRELEQLGRTVGVTSVGRDGEARDAIDVRIEKPRVRLAAGSLVATTDALLRASALEYELVEETGIRTPLGRVAIVRLLQGGAIEVAGPSAAQDVRAVADAMLSRGAEQVLVDGAIDRRAASSPAVCDGLVMCTGAVLHQEIEQVVAITRDAVELVRLPVVEDAGVRALAEQALGEGGGASLLVDSARVAESTGRARDPDSAENGGMAVDYANSQTACSIGVTALPDRFALASGAQEISQALHANPEADHLILRGALHEPFLRGLLQAARGRQLDVVVQDSTKVFLSERGCAWYARQGVSLRVLAPIELRLVTVNPLAPRSHTFESRQLRGLLEGAVPGVAVVDVREGRRNKGVCWQGRITGKQA